MAISATEIFRRHPECFEPATAQLFQEGHDPFDLPGLHFARETADSVAINSIAGGAIIMAGSGMCTGGRVRHHLQHNLGREKSSVVFVGYAAVGTLARRIIDGAKEVTIFGENIPVRARIYTINGFSAHADEAELLTWQKQTSAKRTFLVHGEEHTMRQFAAHLTDTRVEMPDQIKRLSCEMNAMTEARFRQCSHFELEWNFRFSRDRTWQMSSITPIFGIYR